MKLEEAITWLTTEGRFDTEGHCCPKSREAVNTLLDALRKGEIFTFEEIEAVPKAFHDKCMQIEIAKRKKLERLKGKWVTDKYWNVICSACECYAPKVRYPKTNFCGHCGADMRE